MLMHADDACVCMFMLKKLFYFGGNFKVFVFIVSIYKYENKNKRQSHNRCKSQIIHLFM